MPLVLYWHALEEIKHDYAVIAQLVGGSGEVAAEWAQEPACPTSRWQANDLWRDWHDLRVAVDMAPGEYQLVVGLAGGDADEQSRATLGSIEVRGRPCSFQVPDIGYPQVAQLGEGIQLLGYDLPEKQVRAGEVVHLTLYWQAVTESDVSYTVFTHLLDGNSRIWGQKDSLPDGGTLPTTSWMVGEVIADSYEIAVNPDTPTGEYLLEVGMYQATTGQRLPICDKAGTALGDRILLDTVVVVMD